MSGNSVSVFLFFSWTIHAGFRVIKELITIAPKNNLRDFQNQVLTFLKKVYSRIPISGILGFSKLAKIPTYNLTSLHQSNTVVLPPIFQTARRIIQTNLLFQCWFEKSGFRSIICFTLQSLKLTQSILKILSIISY